ncbi:MAG TPA: cation:proton antiporter [Chloroflexota bacterium]|nr:cation:proton antiporter [Chloroflexota bacterium]
MPALSEQQLLFGLLAIAVILLMARAGGELARRLRQPEVLGELFAGFVLGPSILGAFLPAVRSTLFLKPGIALVLSALSWLGAILLLLVAGMEVDVGLLRQRMRSALFLAAGVMAASLAAGIAFAWIVLGRSGSAAFFLGVVLSVTAVSVAAKILIERRTTRRDFGQMILAAGIGTEVGVWLLVSVASPGSSGAAVPALEHGLLAVLFFAFVLVIGKRFVFWSMRRVGDFANVINGQLSLVLVLTLLSAALTQELGLHALLGAFVLGVVLGQAPRANEQLLGNVQSIAIGLFAPIFFVLAGMRVDVLQIRSLADVATIAALFLTASAVKVGVGSGIARLTGRSGREAALVGLGLNLKGGTDVVVAIIGVTLGVMSGSLYTMYALVAIITVLVSPGVMFRLESGAEMSEDERSRLDAEEAEQRAYTRTVERVLVPMTSQLQPELVVSVLEPIARSKHERSQTFDITQLNLGPTNGHQNGADEEAEASLAYLGRLPEVEVMRQQGSDSARPLDQILDQVSGHDLVAIGSKGCSRRRASLGRLQDAVIQRVDSDVLIVASEHERLECKSVQRILVPVNGLEYSIAAGDIAASLAQSCDAELVAYHVVQSGMSELFWRERDRRELLNWASSIAEDLAFRVRRLGVQVQEKVEVDDDAGRCILSELQANHYDLVVMGATVRAQTKNLYLGKAVQAVLHKSPVPVVLLVSRQVPGSSTSSRR